MHLSGVIPWLALALTRTRKISKVWGQDPAKQSCISSITIGDIPDGATISDGNGGFDTATVTLTIGTDTQNLAQASLATPKETGKNFPGRVDINDLLARVREEKKKENQRSYTALELATRSFDLLQDRYCQMLLENYPVDAQIKIARKQCGTLEFHRAAELIEVGRIKTAAALDRMEHGNWRTQSPPRQCG